MNTRDEDLYGGYEDAPGTGSGVFQALGADVTQAVHSPQYGAAPGTAMKQYMPPGTATRMGTAMRPSSDPSRPMTSNRGAGFSSQPNKKFDPLSQTRSAAGGMLGSLLKKGDVSPEEQARDFERRVHTLLEASAVTAHGGDLAGGLDKATEARKLERQVTKFKEANGLTDSINMDLTFAVEFNLAAMFQANKNFKEALDQYTLLVKNKAFPNGGRLRINMGNVYFEQKKYSSAIKMYRMALDQVPATNKESRFKIMRNIGLSFVKMGQYQDALQSFAQVMENAPDQQTGYNLVVCAYALGDREGMKEAFLRLLTVKNLEGEEEDDVDMHLLGHETADDLQMLQDDGLKEELRRRQNTATRCIVSAAQLIAEKIDRQGGFQAGYDWCAEQLRNSGLPKLANEVELAKASKYLSNKDFEAAIAVFKEFEKKEPQVKARAATNLAFLYVLEGQVDNADKYSDLALKSDRYNARAFVNKGCVLMEKGDLEGARQLFIEAAGIEPYCVEAWYNRGLVSMRMMDSQDALTSYRKLHAMLPNNTEVLWQIAMCYDMMGEFKLAVKWLEMLSSLVPNDPGVLARLGAIHARADDEQRALHYYQESHRVYPVHMDVISWLGAYHVKNEVYEKAMPFFDLASKIQPQEVKWALMVASCYRRIGAYPQALSKYKEINITNPGNVECLRYLVHLCTELGRCDDAQKYMAELRKAERAQAAEATAMTVAQSAAQRPDGGAQGMGGSAQQAQNGYDIGAGLNVPVS
eukprot:CAMPEP_0119114344 /NCGR_PEP_ID=MMETSP1180-20130426/47219_1 /TAXON_ID=3052 ORGANISM="Chlamydomonas cf sp, Strain CCMP681" /NCGR_SAMPLE_ID=MMETSP1180 /ASSEMBLY_ACC=CAM_ASM_000741 /LENGTH=751 /DNA_ID=CAMNT_0007102849 /DNA_START=106 /DNA_END=2357 /DNA_ORIENTATION=-